MPPQPPPEQDQLPPEQQACRERTYLEDIQVLGAVRARTADEEVVKFYDRLSLGEVL